MSVEYIDVDPKSDEGKALIKQVDDHIKSIKDRATAQGAKSFEGMYFDKNNKVHGIDE